MAFLSVGHSRTLDVCDLNLPIHKIETSIVRQSTADIVSGLQRRSGFYTGITIP